MTRSLTLLAALAFGALASAAYAQGTDAQREACAPDAVRLCPDTIPDVDRTTACMRTHENELSPRCRREFSAAITESPGAERYERRARREAAEPDDEGPAQAPVPGEREYLYLAPDGSGPHARPDLPDDDRPVARRHHRAPDADEDVDPDEPGDR